jgi:hypothetical protein
MNIKKNVIGFKGITRTTYITKGWRKITGYKTRGHKNRRKLVSRSKTYIDNKELTMHIKKNRIHKLVKRSYGKVLYRM